MDKWQGRELKVFVPAKDFGVSRAFYQALGFTLEFEDEGLCGFRAGPCCAFLLQDFHAPGLAENLMLHLQVDDVDGCWRQFQALDLPAQFGVRCSDVEDRPWGLRDFTLHDPSRVLWRISAAIEPG